MEKKTKLVTSYYAFHSGPPYWGQANRDRWYKHSLACICGMGVEIVCYTDEGDLGFNILQNLKKEQNLDNLTIKTFKLEENPYQDIVYKKRLASPKKWDNPELLNYYSRSNQIYFMKYNFLKKELEKDINLYWIDCGLSHHGLFPPSSSKYNIEPEFKNFYHGENYLTNEYKIYYYDKAFNPEVLQKIVEFTENKIVHLYRTTSDDNPVEFRKEMGFLDIEYNSKYAIAGFFGGDSNLMESYLNVSLNLVQKVLKTKEYLCTEQDIMTHVHTIYKEWFKLFYFDTFYHEGWGTECFPEGSISFSDFFLKKLK